MAQESPAEIHTELTLRDIQPKTESESATVLSTRTAVIRHPKDGTERLKPYRWAKGRSGNPGGRPRKLPLTEGIFEVLQMPISDDVRGDLEAAVGKLPKKFTWAEAYSLGHMLAMFGKLKRFRLDVAREVREALQDVRHARSGRDRDDGQANGH